LPTQLFVIHANLIRDQMADDIERRAKVPYPQEWLGPVYAFFMAFTAIFGSYVAELFPTRVRTTGSSFCFNIGRGVAAFAPFVLGWIAKDYGLATGIALCAGFYFLAALTITVTPRVARPADERRARSSRLVTDQ